APGADLPRYPELMLRLAVIIDIIGGAGPGLMESLPQRSFQLAASYAAFGGDAVVDEKDGYAPVVEVVQAIVGVGVSQLGLMAEGAEKAESLVAEVAALPGDQDQPHASTAIDDCGVWGPSDSRDRPLLDQSSNSAPR